jgi:hypothetical protein
MTITETRKEDRYGEYREYSLSIEACGQLFAFHVYEGEREDNTLGRNFNDCYGIPDLLKLAHQAGAAEEPFEVKENTDA